MDGDEVSGSLPTCSQSDDHGDERRSPLRQIMSDLDVGALTEKPVSDQGCNTSTELSAIERRGPVFLPEDSAGPSREETDADSCRVTLSGFAKGVKVEDVASLCVGAIETGAFLKGDQLVLFNAMYATPEEAVAAVDALGGDLIKGSPFKVKRWHGPKICPLVSSDTLDVYNVPSEFLSKEKLDVVFKMGQVTEVCSTGYCQVKFPTLSELAKTITDPSYHTLAGQNLKFAMAIEPVEANKLTKGKGEPAELTKKSKNVPDAEGFANRMVDAATQTESAEAMKLADGKAKANKRTRKKITESARGKKLTNGNVEAVKRTRKNTAEPPKTMKLAIRKAEASKRTKKSTTKPTDANKLANRKSETGKRTKNTEEPTEVRKLANGKTDVAMRTKRKANLPTKANKLSNGKPETTQPTKNIVEPAEVRKRASGKADAVMGTKRKTSQPTVANKLANKNAQTAKGMNTAEPTEVGTVAKRKVEAAKRTKRNTIEPAKAKKLASEKAETTKRAKENTTAGTLKANPFGQYEKARKK